MGTAFIGERLGEAEDSALGQRVGALAFVNDLHAGDGRGVDDAAVVRLEHIGPHSSCHVPHAEDVDADDEVTGLRVHVLELDAAVDTGVIVQDVDLAVGLDHVVDHLLDLLEVADVALAVVGLQAGLLQLFGGGHNSVRQVNEDNGGTMLGQNFCAAKADALGSAGDDRDFSIKISHFLFSFMH